MITDSNLYTEYTKTIRAKLMKDLGIKNTMEVPALEKIVVNIGMGSYLQKLGAKDFSFVQNNIEVITGQKAVVRYAKLSVSNFKLREGQPVGVNVTLRGKAAYNFLEKLIHVVYPRVRDFRGVRPVSFDKFGNASFGFKDHTVFPEGKQPEDARKIHGVQVTVVTTANNKEQCKSLLDAFGFPFIKPKEKTDSSSSND